MLPIAVIYFFLNLKSSDINNEIKPDNGKNCSIRSALNYSSKSERETETETQRQRERDRESE